MNNESFESKSEDVNSLVPNITTEPMEILN